MSWRLSFTHTCVKIWDNYYDINGKRSFSDIKNEILTRNDKKLEVWECILNKDNFYNIAKYSFAYDYMDNYQKSDKKYKEEEKRVKDFENKVYLFLKENIDLNYFLIK